MGEAAPERGPGMTRRAAVLAGSAVTLTFAAPAAAAQRWQTPFGVKGDEYASASLTLSAQGYRQIHLDAYPVAGEPLYAAVWDDEPGPATTARVGLSGDDLSRVLGEMDQQGRRLSRLCGYEAGGQARYTALWVEAPPGEQQVRYGLTMDQYHRAFGQLTANDYRLSWVRGYAVDGVPYFTAIFDKDGGPDFMARHGLESGQYQDALAEAAAQGYRLRHVCGYAVGDTPYFAAIWEYGHGPAWQAKYNLTADQLGQTTQALSAQGLRLMDVSGYGVRDNPLYAAIWINA